MLARPTWKLQGNWCNDFVTSLYRIVSVGSHTASTIQSRSLLSIVLAVLSVRLYPRFSVLIVRIPDIFARR